MLFPTAKESIEILESIPPYKPIENDKMLIANFFRNAVIQVLGRNHSITNLKDGNNKSGENITLNTFFPLQESIGRTFDFIKELEEAENEAKQIDSILSKSIRNNFPAFDEINVNDDAEVKLKKKFDQMKNILIVLTKEVYDLIFEDGNLNSYIVKFIEPFSKYYYNTTSEETEFKNDILLLFFSFFAGRYLAEIPDQETRAIWHQAMKFVSSNIIVEVNDDNADKKFSLDRILLPAFKFLEAEKSNPDKQRFWKSVLLGENNVFQENGRKIRTVTKKKLASAEIPSIKAGIKVISKEAEQNGSQITKSVVITPFKKIAESLGIGILTTGIGVVGGATLASTTIGGVVGGIIGTGVISGITGIGLPLLIGMTGFLLAHPIGWAVLAGIALGAAIIYHFASKESNDGKNPQVITPIKNHLAPEKNENISISPSAPGAAHI